MPAYNHQRYVAAALDSVVAQSHSNVEIIVVDDGSGDATGTVLDEYAERCRTHAMTVVHQMNSGAPEAINHGLALARGEIVALINSDDLYAADRLECMIAEMDRRGAGLGFSGTRFIDEEGKDIDSEEPYAMGLRQAIAEAVAAPDPLYVLVSHNITTSTGNLVFRRDLLERLGGFCAMRVCHDWDFVLAASYVTRLALLNRPLYLYRLHGSNTFHSARVQAALELEQLQTRFFSRIVEHPLLRDPRDAARFLENARRLGLGGFIRDAGRAVADRPA
jgi:glycosyltransferase involved in cell wall biosynthesis